MIWMIASHSDVKKPAAGERFLLRAMFNLGNEP
jgi:hypothetical protein